MMQTQCIRANYNSFNDAEILIQKKTRLLNELLLSANFGNIV